jgi:TonB family protein
MSDSVQAPSTIAGPHPFDGPQTYTLSSDLARLSLPAEYKDAYRTLAWVNSICFLFLLIGIVGLRPQKIVVRPLNEIQEIVPVVFTPPEEVPKPQLEIKEEEPQPQDKPVESPQVVTIVAAVDSPNIAFSVPVQGAVTIAPATHAPPPPPINQAPPRATKFDPDRASGGIFPKPAYPGSAVRNRHQGTVNIELVVDEAGNVTSAKVLQSSGFSELDEAALKTVRERWKWPPGPPRLFTWPCVFKLE